jgi:uncharacterized protein YegL
VDLAAGAVARRAEAGRAIREAIGRKAATSRPRAARRESFPRLGQPLSDPVRETAPRMNADLTELAFVLDRSGSMQGLTHAAIAGFNDFLREQQAAPGQARLTVVLFDDEYLLHTDSVPVAEVLPLNTDTYVPRGSTALLDAIGRTIDTLGRRLAATPEPQRPGKVVVAILTDGLENASTDYTWKDIAARIRHQRDTYGWDFLFLGANQDAIATAAQMNIAAANAATFSADAAGYGAGTAALSRKTSSGRAIRSRRASQADFDAAAAPMEQLVEEEDRKRREP